MSETTRNPDAFLTARYQMGTTFIGVANNVVLEGAPNASGVEGRTSYAVKYIGSTDTSVFYIVRLSVTVNGETMLNWGGQIISSINETYYITNIQGSSNIAIWGEFQAIDISKYNVSFEVVKVQKLRLNFSTGVTNIFAKRRVDNDYISYSSQTDIFSEVGEVVKCYATPQENYTITGNHTSPATAQNITIADNTNNNYSPTAQLIQKTLTITINTGVAKVVARKLGQNWIEYTNNATITANINDVVEAYAVAASGYTINTGFATSSTNPDSITLNNDKTYAPTASEAENWAGVVIAEIFGDIKAPITFYSNAEQTDSLGTDTANIPNNVEGYGSKWIIKDANGVELLSGIRTPQECGRVYGSFRWVSREGVIKQHIFEIRNQNRGAEAVEFLTIPENFDVRKAQSYGFVGYIDGLTDYDLYYYSDIVTSSKVEFSFDGVNNFRRVNITTDNIEIYTGRENQELTFDVVFCNYEML